MCEPKMPHSPTIPTVDPDFLSGHRHDLRAGAGFQYLSVRVLNRRTGSRAVAQTVLQTVVTAGGGAFWGRPSGGCPVDMGGGAEFRCRESVVIVELEYWGRIVVRAGIRGLVE